MAILGAEDRSEVKVYTVNGAAPGSSTSLPDWLTRRREAKGKRRSEKEHVQSAIDLIQEFNFPEASNRIKTTRDGHHAYATGTYKPCIRAFDLDQLTLKFERHTHGENIDFIILSDDWTKTIHLQEKRLLEFHNQAGVYHTMRIPRQGRSLGYHYPSCDALIGCVGNEVYRLNLDQGRYLNPVVLSGDVEGVNVIDVNPAHQLLAFGTQAQSDGTVEFWDPRSRSRVGILNMPRAQIFPLGATTSSSKNIGLTSSIEVTALCSRSDGLSLAVGTSTGHTLLYDLRSPHHFALKDQGYGLPMKNVIWVEGGATMAGDGMVISADSKVIKIWNRNTPAENFASVTPANDINHVHHIPGSGMMMLANEGTRMTSYYVPQLGPAPRWCNFLDHITEEMEEQAQQSVYEDFKFVERSELSKLGLDHLVGTKALKPYMHGYFVSLKLYDAARVVANPYAYEEHRENLVREKVEKLVESRIRKQDITLPKVNKALASRLQREYEKRTSVLEKAKEAAEEGGERVKGNDKRRAAKATEKAEVLLDPRFKEMFENPEFEMDEDSREFNLLSSGAEPLARAKRRGKTAVEKQAEESDRTSSDGLGKESSEEEERRNGSEDEPLVDMERYKALKAKAKRAGDDGVRQLAGPSKENAVKLQAFPHFQRILQERPKPALVSAAAGLANGKRDATFGEREKDRTPPGKAKARQTEEDEDFDGMEISWTPGEEKPRKTEIDGAPKEKRKKGVQTFGAGMEKGGEEDPTEPLSETQRHGRTERRSRDRLRNASRTTFRDMGR